MPLYPHEKDQLMLLFNLVKEERKTDVLPVTFIEEVLERWTTPADVDIEVTERAACECEHS